MLTTLASADKQAYDNTVSTITSNLISSFKTSLNDNSFTEQAVVAYISAMAQNGNYKTAIEDIPSDYKRSDSRTYLSAPFLNSLASMKHCSVVFSSNLRTNGCQRIFSIDFCEIHGNLTRLHDFSLSCF